MDNQTRKDNQDQDQPESVLNIIRKEFFDLGGHVCRLSVLWTHKIGRSAGMQSL